MAGTAVTERELHRIDGELWEIPASARADMRVPARVFADAAILDEIREDRSLEQLQNVATLPGIVEAALAMPDVHQGYGFPVGGVGGDAHQPDPAAADAPATLLQTVQLVDTPAYVLDRQWDALAWNAHAADLFTGWLDGAHDRNLLRFTFTEPLARALIVDWEARARRLCAEFRADSIRHLNDAPTRTLIDSLIAASDDFTRFWASQ